MEPKVTLTGVKDFEKALLEAGALALPALAIAVQQEQEAVMTVAKERTPVDTGALRGSGTVLKPKIGTTSVTVEAGFGGAASEYAVVVHERMGVNHPVGQAKFLESAFLERVKDIPKNIAERVEQAWRRLSR